MVGIISVAVQGSLKCKIEQYFPGGRAFFTSVTAADPDR